MEVLHPRCAGLDVHKDSVTACVRLASGRQVVREVQEFGTSTRELVLLSEWLESHGATHVGMEATGVYWKPVWHVLEDSFELMLGNAKEIKNVPGRKSDVSDAVWIADLVAHGLIRSNFVPPAPIQALRDLTRTRKKLVRERGQHVQRIQKVLEDANVKLASVLSDITGMSGRAVLDALVRGETDPERLADLMVGRLKASRAERVDALWGRVNEHHRFLLRLHLAQIDSVNAAVEAVEGRIEDALAPFRTTYERLLTMPGVSATVAAVIIAEIGVDMSRFPTHAHLLSWAGLCPRSDESAGKLKSNRSRPGGWLNSPW